MVVHTPLGVFSPRTSLQNLKGRFRGSKLISSNNLELLEPSTSEHYEVEPLSAAKCRVYKRPPNKVLIFIAKKEQLKLSTSLGLCFEIIHSHLRFFCCVENYVIDCYLISLIWSHSILFLLYCQKDDAPIIHLLGGPNLHSLSAITQLNNNTVIFLFWCSEL
jgi:hypothetical protein